MNGQDRRDLGGIWVQDRRANDLDEGIAAYIRILPPKQNRLIKPPHLPRNLHHPPQSRQCIRVILMRPRATIIVGLEVGSNASDGAEEQNGIEVDVLETLGVGGDALDEAGEVWALQAKGEHVKN